MDEVGIILLTLFLFLLVLGPLYRPICITYSRVKDHRKYHPRTSQFEDARQKLSTVSECTTIGREKLDVESSLNQHDSGPEWMSLSLTLTADSPICIGPLFVSSSGHASVEGPTQAMPSQASGTGGDGSVLEGSGGQLTHSGVAIIKKLVEASKWRLLQLRKEKASKSPSESPDDEILTLKICQHAFHAKCLSSWFLIERYDCPVCRSQYWLTREMRARAASAPPGRALGAGPEIARPPPVRFTRLTAGRLSVPII
ncbi:uncharacterized protein CTRU02_201060 [Colletotrichum truncatum]|uniref:Uncharacterized protein n=1 Tax=Colletotrichum truncatum TaxID=5467 RepID=A0ACC3ZGE8_COLTU|nr:uncharacterized protein CTRU02_12371 [Colletotrichum truncatum]KAF6784666.1 hypothetical protein CTRU02_12371 [Colletotrichum truncatum]